MLADDMGYEKIGMDTLHSCKSMYEKSFYVILNEVKDPCIH